MTTEGIVKSVQDVSSVDDDPKEEDSEEDESILHSDVLVHMNKVHTYISRCSDVPDEVLHKVEAGAQPVAEEPEGEEDEDDEVPVRPSASEVMEALNVTRLFFSFEEGEEDSLRRVRAL
ncbi:hypothetical protein HPB50_028319 [Hyalomma asiaticum]|nr:hypothetical protein HPB50_028319 [Hyalomma asiaticum]